MGIDEIRKAKMILCGCCQSDMCEWCIVEHIVNEAEMKHKSGEEDDEFYIRSSTNGDYSPSDPWNAPGMSMSDFI